MGKIAIDYNLFLSLAFTTLEQIDKELDEYFRNKNKNEARLKPWGKYKRIAEQIFDLTDEKILSNVDLYHFEVNKRAWLQIRDMSKVILKDIEMMEDEFKSIEDEEEELLID